MEKTITDLIQGKYLPKRVQDKMYETEAGVLALGLEIMVYERGHDATMHSIYPEKVFLGNEVYKYTAEKLGYELPYAKSDVIVRGAINLLMAIALKEGLER